MYKVAISPLGDGWKVSCDAIENDLVFRQGSAAESTARRLVGMLAELDGAAEFRILLRDGFIADIEIPPVGFRAIA